MKIHIWKAAISGFLLLLLWTRAHSEISAISPGKNTEISSQNSVWQIDETVTRVI